MLFKFAHSSQEQADKLSGKKIKNKKIKKYIYDQDTGPIMASWIRNYKGKKCISNNLYLSLSKPRHSQSFEV